MTECDYITDEQGRHVCSRCGNVQIAPHLTPDKIHRICPKAENHSGPTKLERVINFAKAAFAHAPLVAEAILTGDESKAFRSQAEIEAIAKTCKACPLFNGEVCTHKDCGCPIDTQRSAWWSKIAWRRQRCPDDPPRWQ